MEQISRILFTPQQKADLWERWRSGQCVADIARALGRRNKSGVYRLLAVNGGIAPNVRRRSPLALRLDEREEISRGLAAGRSIREIARGLGRAASTVAGRSDATVAAMAIEQAGPISGPGTRRCVPKSVAWRGRHRYDGAWPRNWRSNGRRSKSPAG